MIINIEFTTARGYKYETMHTEFDRNYRDEEQALIFMESEEDDFDGYFEVNIRKDEHGKPVSKGYVCEYASTEDSEPQAIYEDAKIEVKLHDFDDVVELANAELVQDGLQIVLEYDGVWYWAIGTQIKATKEIKWYILADFENEVREHIYECWTHARAMADSLKEGKANDNPKMWCVTYVGLSDSEYDANGHSEVALYATKDAAKAKLKAWRDSEIENLKDEDREYEIHTDEDDEVRISWCGHGEQVRIEVHEVELNK